MRKVLAFTAAAASVVAVAAGAAPAAADTVDATFTVSAGTLAVASASTASNLGSSTASALGTTVTGTLPKVTVTDDRGSIAGWTSQVASTDFTATVNATTQTIAASKAKAYIVVTNGPTLLSGTAVPVTTAIDAATGIVLAATAKTLVTATTTGSNQVAYTPTLQVTIDSTVLPGTYAGKVTHTVV